MNNLAVQHDRRVNSIDINLCVCIIKHYVVRTSDDVEVGRHLLLTFHSVEVGGERNAPVALPRFLLGVVGESQAVPDTDDNNVCRSWESNCGPAWILTSGIRGYVRSEQVRNCRCGECFL